MLEGLVFLIDEDVHIIGDLDAGLLQRVEDIRRCRRDRQLALGNSGAILHLDKDSYLVHSLFSFGPDVLGS
jgi:hypothetical protein